MMRGLSVGLWALERKPNAFHRFPNGLKAELQRMLQITLQDRIRLNLIAS